MPKDQLETNGESVCKLNSKGQTATVDHARGSRFEARESWPRSSVDDLWEDVREKENFPITITKIRHSKLIFLSASRADPTALTVSCVS